MSAKDTKDLGKTLGKALNISGWKKDDVIDNLIHSQPSGLFQLNKHGKLVGCLVEQAMLKDKKNPYDNESKKIPPRLFLLLNKVSNGNNDGNDVVLYKYNTKNSKTKAYTPGEHDTFYKLVSKKEFTNRPTTYKLKKMAKIVDKNNW